MNESHFEVKNVIHMDNTTTNIGTMNQVLIILPSGMLNDVECCHASSRVPSSYKFVKDHACRLKNILQVYMCILPEQYQAKNFITAFQILDSEWFYDTIFLNYFDSFFFFQFFENFLILYNSSIGFNSFKNLRFFFQFHKSFKFLQIFSSSSDI